MLGIEGEDARTSEFFYVVVVQAVLLYGSETRITSLHIGSNFGGFQHRVARILTVHQPRKVLYGM